jgi:DNA-binding GntR family transcriptional regulator
VREACIRLNSEKLLESVPNKGYSVASISMNAIHELFQLRGLLEEFTVQEACSKNNPELLGKNRSFEPDRVSHRGIAIAI